MKPLLLYGDEKYLIDRRVAALRGKLLPQGAELMNLDVFDGKAATAGRIIDAATTAPFMADCRVVLVTDSGLFAAGRKDDAEAIADFLDDIPEWLAMVFTENAVDKRGRLYKKLASKGEAVEMKPLGEKELPEWLRGEAASAGASLTRDCAALMLRTVGADMFALRNELAKAAACVDGKAAITADIIRLVCTPSLQARIFDLVGAVGNKNTALALDIYSNMLMLKESPLMILVMIARQFRLMLQCAALAKKGANAGEISERLNLRGFVTTECLKQAANFSAAHLCEILERCLETDIAVKTGLTGDRLGVETLIISLG